MADVTVVNAVLSHNPRVPLGPLYLCAVLEASGYEVDFRDYQLCDGTEVGSPDGFAAWLEGAAPILALSTLSSSLPLVLAALGRTRLRDAVETVVLGGAGVNGLGHEILASFPAVDAVARGEGEMTLVELVRRAGPERSLAGIPGLCCREGDSLRTGPPRPRVTELDDLPYPAYHHVDLQRYTELTSFDRIPLAVISSRGCPYRCSFCDIPGIWGGGVRFRSVANVIGELAFLNERYEIPRFHVSDDTFVLDRRRVLDFCSALEESCLTMAWSCLGRVDRVDGALLDRMAEAGCDTIFYGVESGNDEILRRIGKGFRLEQAFEAVRISVDRMETHVSFIWGFPFESLGALYDTIIALLDMYGTGAVPHLNFLAPLPSAALGRSVDSSLLPLLASDIGWDWAMMENYTYDNELRAIIRNHPNICAPFYCFDSPDFDRKVRLLESWGLGRGVQDAWPAAPDPAVAAPPHEPEPFLLDAGHPLPRVSEQVCLRTVGGQQVLLDLRDCLLYRPPASYVELFRACRASEDSTAFVVRLSRATGESTEQVWEFVRSALSTFAQRGFLDEGFTP